MAVKLDIRKAYDRVNWNFLCNIMLKLGFDIQWVQLAMVTVCTTSNSMLINEELGGFISPTRSIKQGDPLSPYFFLLCAEGLSALLRKDEENQILQGILFSPCGVRISHRLIASFFAVLLWRRVKI